MKITFYGQSALLIESNESRLIIDPFLNDNPLSPIKSDQLPKIDYICLTHGHSDHMGDCESIAKRDNATIIANFEICSYLAEVGLTCSPMHIGGANLFAFGRLKMTPALHGSGINSLQGMVYGGNPAGFLLSIDGLNIYHAGDTGLSMEMQLLADESVDLAFLPIGGNFTMDVKDALKATQMIQPKEVVPIHYDTFPLIKADPTDFMAGLKGCRGVLMAPGDSIER